MFQQTLYTSYMYSYNGEIAHIFLAEQILAQPDIKQHFIILALKFQIYNKNVQTYHVIQELNSIHNMSTVNDGSQASIYLSNYFLIDYKFSIVHRIE